MPVQNWMTTDVVSVGPDTSLLKVGKLMKDHHIRRIPVVDEQGQVIGIISDRDVRDASPSKATTLDMYEMHYLLAELKAKNIMTAKPITVKPTDTVEQAALIMRHEPAILPGITLRIVAAIVDRGRRVHRGLHLTPPVSACFTARCFTWNTRGGGRACGIQAWRKPRFQPGRKTRRAKGGKIKGLHAPAH